MKRLLVGVDGSQTSRFALDWALAHAHAIGGSVTVVTAAPRGALLEPTPSLYWTPDEHLREEAARLQAEVLQQASNPGVTVVEHVIDGHPAKILCEFGDADLVVMGARGLGSFGGAVLGSVAHQVASHTERPLVVVKQAPEPVRTVMMATDGSNPSRRAAEVAVTIARAHGASVELVMVTPRLTSTESMAAVAGVPVAEMLSAREAAAREQLEGFAAQLGSVDDLTLTALHGQVAEELAEHAQAVEADLVAVGTRGRGGFKRLLLGSVSHRLLQEVGAPLLLVP